MKYNLIIFDLDGTIIDSSKSILYSFTESFKELGVQISEKEIRNLLGYSLKEVYSVYYKENIQKAIDTYRKYYFTVNNTLEKPYSGIIKTIKELSKNSILAIATNKGPNGTLQALERHNLKRYFKYISYEDGTFSKPAKEVLDKILTNLATCGYTFDKNEILMIGDSPTDLEFSRNSDIKFGFVSWGFFTLNDLKSPADYIFDKPSDIIDLIKDNSIIEIDITNELDLHNFDINEIPSAIDNYINICKEKNFKTVRIITGKGRFKKRNISMEILNNNKNILSYRIAPSYAGGDGALIVYIK